MPFNVLPGDSMRGFVRRAVGPSVRPWVLGIGTVLLGVVAFNAFSSPSVKRRFTSVLLSRFERFCTMLDIEIAAAIMIAIRSVMCSLQT